MTFGELRLLALFWCALFIGSCGYAAAPSDPVPQHDPLTVASKVLGEDRTINVWLPPSYAETDKAFPVVYMPDGGVKEDFPHIANTLAELSGSGKIPPVILVGIENTERRRDLTPSSTTAYDRDYGPAGDGASAFRTFIAEELIPLIETRYRTAQGRTIVGESAAGLFVIDTFFRQPALFDSYIAMDPALWWDDHALVRQASEKLPDMDLAGKSLWFAGSSAKDIRPHTRSLSKILQSNAPPALRWTYRDSPKEKHTTIFRATKDDGFVWTLGEATGG